MNIEVSEIDGQLTHIRLSGRLDSPGVDRIETQFVAALVSPGRHGIVDLSQVSFLASMGIRMLISSGRALNLKGSKLALYGATDLVKTVLDHVALDQIIPVVATRQEAIERLG
jgi:anti-sigma B factor antagonist